jgi:hypothetical protein
MFEAYSFVTSPADARHRDKVMSIEPKAFRTVKIFGIFVIEIHPCGGLDASA